MQHLFDLNTYKNYLINYFRYPCDSSEEKKNERKKILESRYSDNFLIDIIVNTEDFIISILEQNIDNDLIIELEEDTRDVFTNCTGGFHPDILIPINGSFVSKYLLSAFFGNQFHIEIDDEEIEYYDDEDESMIIGGVYFIPRLIITGDFSLIKARYDAIKKQEKEYVLKRMINKPEIGVYN